MQLNVKFSELSGMLRQKTGQYISFYGSSSDTVRIGYDLSVKVPVIGEVNKHFDIFATFNKIVGNDLYLSLHDKIALLASGALFVFDIKSIVEECSDGFVVHLDGIDKLEPILEKVHVHDLSFADDELTLDFDVDI